MKKIQLRGEYGKGKFVLVDDEDFEYLRQFRWRLTDRGYVVNCKTIKLSSGKYTSKITRMSRTIMCIMDRKIYVDHANHDKLDNRKRNLRPCTPAQNQWNSKPRGGTSKYKGVGVCYRLKINKWSCSISFHNKKIHLGEYKKETDAAIAYDKAAIEYFGEFALTNFPKENYA